MNGLSVSSDCLRSQGQPSGPRSVVISCTRSSNERLDMGRHSTGHHFCYDHHLRGTPQPPMSDQVLIVGTEPAAKTPAEIAISLRFTPVIAGSEEEALGLLDQESFSL